MSASSSEDDRFVTVGIDAHTEDRYADVTLEDGVVMIYDEDNQDAWFQSDSAIALDAMA